MFSFFKKKPAAPAQAPTPPAPPAAEPAAAPVAAAEVPPTPAPTDSPAPAERAGWFGRLRQGLAKTGSNIAQVFTGTRIDEALYEELEAALLMADAGVKAT